MSALRMVAWGMVDFRALTPKEFRDLRKQIRDELRCNTRMRIVAMSGRDEFALYIRVNQPWGKRIKRSRRRAHHKGTLESCCRVAFNLIYPEGNHEADPR